MIALAAPAVRTAAQVPTIWGCTPQQVHDRFWAAFGVQVVRRGERSETVAGAELFLLCERKALVLFRLTHVLDDLYWLRPALLGLRLRDERSRPSREVAVAPEGKLLRFSRIYRRAGAIRERVALTASRDVARLWQILPTESRTWHELKSAIPADRRAGRAVSARVYDGRDDSDVMACLRDMMRYWRRPDATMRCARGPLSSVFADESAEIRPGAEFHGAVWVGAGRSVAQGEHVVGPAVLWDDPSARPPLDELRWPDIEATQLDPGAALPARARPVPGKRLFDIAFASFALFLTAPLYPLVALAILAEDGGPVFFAHRRETRGGREFPCLKFRSMRKDADQMKARLAAENQADGPQFFIDRDPRITRVGRVLRKFHLDELPQFLNVLAGHMSVVGPRPSPYSENQFCPVWREARLSVRPGVTGLWQVSRTRRKGLDFQEWIRFDLEYIARAGWAMDLAVIAKTVALVVRGGA
jgi:lipopolysaccharide/colanic/teichoic acid biosynthesis glycosyltransferase